MCGRYTGVKFHSGEIFPTNTVPLLTEQKDELAPVPGTWGYPGYNGKGVIINARAETAGVKPTLAESLRYRRRGILSGRVRNGSFCSVSRGRRCRG